MHVLIPVLHRPTKPTGVCRFAANLARCLSESAKITQITLVVGIWQKEYFENEFFLCHEKIKFITIDIKNNSLSRNLWFLFRLPKLVNEILPDIVHLSFPLPFIRSKFPCPVIATIHDLYPYQLPKNFGYHQALFNQLFLQQCVHQSDSLACVSQTTLNSLIKFFPERILNRKKIAVLYNFVDFEEIEPQFPTGLQVTSDMQFILCVGQHRKNKNIDLLIKAYALLIHEYRNSQYIKLVIVGSPGPETDDLIQLIQKLGLESSIYLLSSLKDNELCWLYQHCSVFSIPSSLEGFCIPLVEALYFSCKVVCSNIPIFKEIGSSNCIYFDLEETPIENLLKAIIQSLESEKPKQDSKNIYFTKALTSSQVLQLYSEICK